MPHDPAFNRDELAARMMWAALAEHPRLSDALAAMKDAAAQVFPGETPTPLLALPSPEVGCDTRSPRRPRQPRPAAAEDGAAPRKHDRSWIEPTLAAVAAMERAGDAVTRSGLMRRLDIPPAAASWRLRQLATMGKLAMIGARSRTSYRLAGEPPPAAPEPIRPVQPPPVATPPVPARPRPEPPSPRPAPASAVLVSVDRTAPPLPDEPVEIDAVVRVLRSRDFSVTGGPEQFTVDGQRRDMAWLVERANRIRAGRGERPFVLRG